MIAYVDTSVLLRLALGQPNTLRQWRQVDRAVSSALTRVEALRTLDRLRLRLSLVDVEVARRRAAILQLLDSMELVGVDAVVLGRAEQTLPTDLKTLDAIHLATALLWSQSTKLELVMATHDTALGIAALAQGLKVIGT